MAAAARTASRAFVRSTPATSSFRPAARSPRFTLPTQAFRASSRRGYASEAGPAKSSKAPLFVGLLAAGGAGAYFYLNGDTSAKGPFVPTQQDYQKVYNEIAGRLEDSNYDDGSYGPVSRLSAMRWMWCLLTWSRFWSASRGTQAAHMTWKPAPGAATARR